MPAQPRNGVMWGLATAVRNSLRLSFVHPLADRPPGVALFAAPHELVGAGLRATRFECAEKLVRALKVAVVARGASEPGVGPGELDALVIRADDLDDLLVVIQKIHHLEAAARLVDLLRRRVRLGLI